MAAWRAMKTCRVWVTLWLVTVPWVDAQRPSTELYEGSTCSLPNGSLGTCKLLGSCPAQQNILKANPGYRPTPCSFRGADPIVCCAAPRSEAFVSGPRVPQPGPGHRGPNPGSGGVVDSNPRSRHHGGWNPNTDSREMDSSGDLTGAWDDHAAVRNPNTNAFQPGHNEKYAHHAPGGHNPGARGPHTPPRPNGGPRVPGGPPRPAVLIPKSNGPAVNSNRGPGQGTRVTNVIDTDTVAVSASRKTGERSNKACADYSREAINKQVAPLIHSGLPTLKGEFPHMALLGYIAQGTTTLTWNCGGALISNRFVITAAHCFTERSLRAPVRVRLGEYDLKDNEDDAKDYGIESHVLHPQYKSQAWYDDLALIKLNQDVVFTTYILPVCLWTQPQDPNTGLVVTGWGSTTPEADEGTQSNVLLKGNGTLSRVAPEVCAESFKAATKQLKTGIQDGMLCAVDSTGSVDTCKGDSGGPIQVKTKQKGIEFSIVGITSGGWSVCGGRTPSIYTRVYRYLDWIEDNVWPNRQN